MTKRMTTGEEMPAPGEGRPLGGQLDSLNALFDFHPTFVEAVGRVTSPDSDTRRALHELVCIVATRLHVEREILLPLFAGLSQGGDFASRIKPNHRHIEGLLARIDRRAPSDPDLMALFEELQAAVRSNLEHQQTTASAAHRGLSEDQAARLRSDLMRAVDTAMTRPHPHLPHHGALGRAASAVIGSVDRLRNHAPVR
jgi:hypothetical protein